MDELSIRVAAMRKRSKCEGPGIRFVIWVKGCTLKCKGCFNPHFWSQQGGSIWQIDSVLNEIVAARIEFPEIEGVTFLGGEPFEQAEPLAELSEKLREIDFSVMVFSGYTLTELKDPKADKYKARRDFLASIDLLVDGRYQENNIDLERPWVGSKNQKFHFLSQRYSRETLFKDQSDGLEIRVLSTGEIQVNGWASNSQLDKLLEHL